LVELTVADRGPPPHPLCILSLGSFGRREVVPSSDIDSALAWDGDDDGEAEAYMERLGARVTADLAGVGFPADTHGATAAKPLFRRSVQSWREAIRSVIENPEQENALTFISLLSDARLAYRLGDARDPLEELAQIRHRRPLLRLLVKLALVHRPPTGLRRLRASHREPAEDGGGERRGGLDIKEVGLLPITSIARYASLAAGAHATSTRERLSLASIGGTLDGRDARTLSEAFDLFWRLRLEHQVEQIRAGGKPDDFIEVEQLTPVTRGYVREAFHAVSSVQRRLRGDMALPP
jgi:CBS domain-containing protein